MAMTATANIQPNYVQPKNVVLKFTETEFAQLQTLLSYAEPIYDDEGQIEQLSIDALVELSGILIEVGEMIRDARN